jgi:hypothetical protein
MMDKMMQMHGRMGEMQIGLTDEWSSERRSCEFARVGTFEERKRDTGSGVEF